MRSGAWARAAPTACRPKTSLIASRRPRLFGVGPGHACTSRGVLGIGVPQATAIADARAARMRHLDETGVYVHVIADGGMATGGDIAKAIVCGADAVMVGSPLAAANEAPGINTLFKGEPSLVWKEARGSNVLDVDGNCFVDFTSGFGVASIGHRHPRIVAAIGDG